MYTYNLWFQVKAALNMHFIVNFYVLQIRSYIFPYKPRFLYVRRNSGRIRRLVIPPYFTCASSMAFRVILCQKYRCFYSGEVKYAYLFAILIFFGSIIIALTNWVTTESSIIYWYTVNLWYGTLWFAKISVTASNLYSYNAKVKKTLMYTKNINVKGHCFCPLKK